MVAVDRLYSLSIMAPRWQVSALRLTSLFLCLAIASSHKEKDKSGVTALAAHGESSPPPPHSTDKSKGSCADDQEPECVDWCAASAAEAHCSICSCKGCGFCEAIERLHNVAACIPHDSHGTYACASIAAHAHTHGCRLLRRRRHARRVLRLDESVSCL